jgi:hypothetical protein
MSTEEALEQDGEIVRAFEGDSMMPMLDQARDLVRIVKIDSVPLPWKVCDLPLYKRPNGQLVLHRIIGIRKKYVITCGDNRSNAEKVPYEWIIGMAKGFYKDGVYISCSDEEYLRYARKRRRGRLWRCALFRFRLMRGVRRVVHWVCRQGKKLFRRGGE